MNRSGPDEPSEGRHGLGTCIARCKVAPCAQRPHPIRARSTCGQGACLASTGWASREPARSRSRARKKAVKAPVMVMSPWAKLIRRRMP